MKLGGKHHGEDREHPGGENWNGLGQNALCACVKLPNIF